MYGDDEHIAHIENKIAKRKRQIERIETKIRSLRDVLEDLRKSKRNYHDTGSKDETAD